MSDRTQDLKNLRAVATACKNYVDETKEQILWQVGQYNITTQDDNTTAYQKVVPTGATRAKIKSIGGMSYKSENLCNLTDKAESTTSGITSKVENGIITLTGTNTSSGAVGIIFKFNEFNGTYGMLLDGYKNVFQNGVQIRLNGTYVDTIATNEDSKVLSNRNFDEIRLIVASGMTINATIKPMIVSGSTAPTEYKPYFTGIRDSAITSIKSYDSNNNLIDTYTIPSEIQALEGYGRGINENCYNELDLNTKAFTDKDSVVDLGSLTWNAIQIGTSGLYRMVSNGISTLVKKAASPTSLVNLLCAIYTSKTASETYSQQKGVSIDDYGNIIVYDENYNSSSSATAFKTAMNGVNLQYELATYETEDVSAYLSNNVIEVEAGGYLVFENQYGQAVPSNITYRIEVES